MNQWLGPSSPDALITLSRTVFCGEGGPVIVEVSDSDGIDATNERLMFDALETHPTIEAVYSVGGGNTAIVAEVEAVGRVCRVFIAHDLDADNRRLPRESRISVVLRTDARLTMRLILQQRGALPVEPSRPVPIQVITPYYLPT